jgi:GTPase SAR1 family protein
MQSNIINAWIVVTVDETIPEISEIISKAGCNVLTLDKLLRQLHDYETPLKRHVSLYENQSIFLEDLFINLKATKETGESIDNIVHYIENWIHTGEGAQLTLLGDFGSGKTTISDRLMHNCAIKYIEGETDRIPILLRLRDLGAGNTIEASITNILVNQYKLDINFNVFNSLNKMGKFLLILDGFDEIPFTITETAILRAFREIDKLVEENSKVILTCRTHFFKDNSMIHELYKGTILYDAIAGKLGYELVFLEAFSREQVRDYIERWAKEDSTKFMNTIEEVYNLSDLATRPVLLNMIAKTIPQLDKMAQSTVNAASLYSLYIRFWLERDDWRSELTVPQRKSLAKLLSSFFFLGGLSEIHHTDLPLLTKQISTIHKNINVDIIEYELRTCNFLRRDHNGTYRFVHKSFMEYLLAQNIVDEMFNNNHDLSLRWLLPVETKSPPKGMIFGTTEMESFFFQIIESKLLDINPEDLYEITKNRKRTHNLTANTIYKLKLLGFGSFFAKSLIDQIVPIDVNMAAHCLTLSNDFDKQFEWIVSTITTNRSRSIDPDKLAIAYDCLVDALRTKEQKYIDALTDAIKTYELSMDNTECGSNDGITTKGYPYLRSEKRKALEIILKDLVDPAEIIKARKEFYRNWEKDKAIYNQKQEIEIKQEKLTFKESFSKDLKK